MKTLLCLMTVLLGVSAAGAQTTQPVASPALQSVPVPQEFVRLKQELEAAYNRGDIDGMLKFLHPEVLIVFPDARQLEGREALRGYYDQMLKGPSAIVKSYTTNPVVDGRRMQGDVDLSWGRMNDHYVLTDGTEFGLNSRFTVTLIRSADGPVESGGWMIRSFHSSTDAFDNPVLRLAVKRTALYAGIGGAVLGLLVGVIGTALVARRRRSADVKVSR